MRRAGAILALALLATLTSSGPASAWTVVSGNGDVHISNVHINGGGSQMKVTAGSIVKITFSYSIIDPCLTCRDQLEVGWSDRGPHKCVFDGQTPGSGTASFSLTAPSQTGEYYIAVDEGRDSACGATLAVPGPTWWNGNPPDPDTRLIGRVGVATTINTFHVKINGTVGAVVKISAVHINSGGNQATVASGSDVQVSVNFFINDTACTTCEDELQVGLSDTSAPVTCLFIGVPGPFGDSVTNSRFHFTAPQPGSYFLAFDREQSPSGCSLTAWSTSPSPLANPKAGKRGDTQFFGHLTVT